MPGGGSLHAWRSEPVLTTFATSSSQRTGVNPIYNRNYFGFGGSLTSKYVLLIAPYSRLRRLRRGATTTIPSHSLG